MRRARLVAVVVAVAGFSCVPGLSAQAQAADRADSAIRQAVRDYDDAWGRKDAAAFEELLSPGYVYFTSKGAVWPKQRWLGLMLSPKYALESARRGDIVVHAAGDSAVVGSRWQGHGSYDGKPFRDDQRCSLALWREATRWRILSEHCTQIVP